MEADMSEKETEEKLLYLRKRILTLEWDKENNQINSGMLKQYEEAKNEYSRLSEKLRLIRSDKQVEE